MCVRDVATRGLPEGAVHLSVALKWLFDCSTCCLAASCINNHVLAVRSSKHEFCIVFIVLILGLFRSRVSDVERSLIHPLVVLSVVDMLSDLHYS